MADETAAGGREEPSECGTARRQSVGLTDRLFGAYAPLLVGLLLGWVLGSLRVPAAEEYRRGHGPDDAG